METMMIMSYFLLDASRADVEIQPFHELVVISALESATLGSMLYFRISST